MIVGLSGKKQSGKDTVALMWKFIDYHEDGAIYNSNEKTNIRTYLIEKFDANQEFDYIERCTLQTLAFADSLKTIVGILALPEHKIEDYKFLMSLEVIKRSTSGIFSPSANKYLTIRELLQVIGTEICRVISPDIWINIVKSKIHSLQNCIDPDDILVTDVRFKDEANMLSKQNAILIRINRDNVKKSDHISETDLDDFEFKYVIDNNGTFDELFEQVYKIYKQVHN